MTDYKSNKKNRSVMAMIIKLLTEHPKILSVLLLSCFVSIFSEGLGLGLIVPLLQPELASSIASELPVISELTGWLETMDLPARVKTASLMLFVIVLVRNGMAMITRQLTLVLQKKIEYDLKMRAFKQIHDIDLRYIYGQKISGLLTTINRYTWQASGMMNTVIGSISNIFTIAVYFAIMLMISWSLTLTAALLLAVVAIISYKLMFTHIQSFGIEEIKSQRKLRDFALESLSAIKILHLFNKEKSNLERIRRAVNEHQRFSYGGKKLTATLIPLFTTGCAALIAVGLYFVATYNPEKILEWVSLMVLLLVIVFRLMSPASSLINAMGRIRTVSPAFVELMNFIDRSNKPYLRNGSKKFSSLENSIEFRNVSFAYGINDQAAITDACFTVPRGSVTAIVGRSGAGKTTLVDLLARLYDCDSGTVLIDDVDIKQFDIGSWRSALAIVDQDTFLFNGSVKENLLFAKPTATEEQIIDSAIQAEAHEFIMALPEKYQTILGDRGVRLSGGQRQRIAIARAILLDPKILVLDEATSDLDAETERSIQFAIERFSETRTVLLIAHRLSTIRSADNIVVLDSGTVAEQGTYSYLMSLKGTFWNLVKAQQTDFLTDPEDKTVN